MAQTFKVGDVVQLKSGGPIMTVGSVENPPAVWCVWFAGNKKEGATFSADTLKLAKE